ncbi:MAG: radical SAM protein [Thermoleophilia bacterium]
MSLAAAMTLGLRAGAFYRDARLHCLNLLLTYPEGCEANCSYCGLRRARENGKNQRQSFIRVEWPHYHINEIIQRAGAIQGGLERVCVSMIMHPQAFDDTLRLVTRLHRDLSLPVSVLANPTSMEPGMMEDLKAAGADMLSVAMDAVTPELFDEHRGAGVGGPHRWGTYWESLEEAALVFGRDKFGCHLIAGLGESEKQMVEAIQKVRKIGGRSHLFAFYPESGSLLQGQTPCAASTFRRVQLARFLLDYDLVAAEEMEFDEYGRLASYGLSGDILDELVKSGKPFMTSGCPGSSMSCACNRPFGDGPPSDIRSYPFMLSEEDIMKVRKELSTYQGISETVDVKV